MRSELKQTRDLKLRFLYTNIGRGHPYYLDGIAEVMIDRGLTRYIRAQDDVFDMSKGLSKAAWLVARYLYRRSPAGGFAGKLYQITRHNNDYNRGGLPVAVMGRSLRKKLLESSDPLLVAHPSLVGIMAGRENLLYQHGELVAPKESLVRGASLCLVPTAEVADKFIGAGYDRDSIFVSGLCVEPQLSRRASDRFHDRLLRLEQGTRLTAALYSSGAEPPAHVNRIVDIAESLARSGQRAFIFARRSGRLETRLIRRFEKAGLELIQYSVTTGNLAESANAVLFTFANRREESALTTAVFEHFDLLVAPAHERSNWAVGLGLPMFILEPCFGPFAPLNRDLLVKLGVGLPLDQSSAAIAAVLPIEGKNNRRRLSEMASAGRGKYQVDGFEKIVDLLMKRYFED